MPAQPPDDDAGDFTLRQLVERFAAENGLTFMPKHGRTMAGLQVRPSSPPASRMQQAFVALSRPWHARL